MSPGRPFFDSPKKACLDVHSSLFGCSEGWVSQAVKVLMAEDIVWILFYLLFVFFFCFPYLSLFFDDIFRNKDVFLIVFLFCPVQVSVPARGPKKNKQASNRPSKPEQKGLKVLQKRTKAAASNTLAPSSLKHLATRLWSAKPGSRLESELKTSESKQTNKQTNKQEKKACKKAGKEESQRPTTVICQKHFQN